MLHRLPVNQNANLQAGSNASASYIIRNARNIEHRAREAASLCALGVRKLDGKYTRLIRKFIAVYDTNKENRVHKRLRMEAER